MAYEDVNGFMKIIKPIMDQLETTILYWNEHPEVNITADYIHNLSNLEANMQAALNHYSAFIKTKLKEMSKV